MSVYETASRKKIYKLLKRLVLRHLNKNVAELDNLFLVPYCQGERGNTRETGDLMKSSRILLIDDDFDIRHLTKLALMKHGYQVAAFQNADEGIKDARKNIPDLILMDIMLPEMSGPEAIQILRSEESLKNIPIIFLTALIAGNETPVEDLGLSVGGLNYRMLGKPYEIDKLLEAIKEYI